MFIFLYILVFSAALKVLVLKQMACLSLYTPVDDQLITKLVGDYFSNGFD